MDCYDGDDDGPVFVLVLVVLLVAVVLMLNYASSVMAFISFAN